MTSNGYGTFLKTIEGQPTETVAQEAVRITGGDGARRQDYGDVATEFGNVGRAWAAILSAHFKQPIPDIPADVMGLMMVALKVCREAQRPKRDNRVDMIGYSICVDVASPDTQQEAS